MTCRRSQPAPSQKQNKRTRRRTNPFPYKVEDGRLWRQIENVGNDGATPAQWVPFASEVNVLAYTRDPENQNWGRLVEVVDSDDERHVWPMPCSLLAGSGEEVRAILLGLGMELSSRREARQWLMDYLASAEPDQRARCVDRIGWHGERYVLPDETLGQSESDERVVLQSAERLTHAFNVSGTLDQWRENIAHTAVGNSRLIFAISIAFAAPILSITGDEGGGFHLRGASSSGKSTALEVAGSVWGGGPRGFVKQWRASDNGLECIAEQSNDSLLCLDDLSQVDPRVAARMVYMLANGRGKARARQDAKARRVPEWCLLVFSTGEIGLADKVREGGGRAATGTEVRIVDLPADAGAGMGLFEDTHGATNPSHFAQDLKRAANAYYGTPARALVSALAENRAQYQLWLQNERLHFERALCLPEADGQVHRVAERFALVAAAGELATDLGLTGWPRGVAKDAALRCFEDWLAERGGTGPGEVSEACRRLAEALEVHGVSRFQQWDGKPESAPGLLRWGFVRVELDEQQNPRNAFYILPQALKHHILSGLDRKTVVAELMELGVVIPHSGAPYKTYHVPSSGKHRLYEIDANALSAALAD